MAGQLVLVVGGGPQLSAQQTLQMTAQVSSPLGSCLILEQVTPRERIRYYLLCLLTLLRGQSYSGQTKKSRKAQLPREEGS